MDANSSTENKIPEDQSKEMNAQGSIQVFLVLFIIFFSIVLVNLLVGLAVSEIEKERQEATTLHNRLAVYEINRYWKHLDKSIYLKFKDSQIGIPSIRIHILKVMQMIFDV